jgi:hypothetical protein
MVFGVQVGDYWRACPQAFRVEATGSGPLALPAKSRGGRARGRSRPLSGVPPPVQLKSGRGRTPRRRSRAPGDSSLCAGRGGAPVAQRLGFAGRPRPALDPDLPRSGPSVVLAPLPVAARLASGCPRGGTPGAGRPPSRSPICPGAGTGPPAAPDLPSYGTGSLARPGFAEMNQGDNQGQKYSKVV